MKTDPMRLVPGMLLLACLGCNRDQVQSVRIEKAAPAPASSPAPAMPPPPQAASTLKWTLPKGWTAESSGGMRFATLKPATKGKAEVSVVTLTGTAGGELANVNRWRAQLGLPPVEGAALAPARKTVASKAGPVAVFEFGNAGSRMVVGLLSAPDGNTWFLKLMGEDAPVNQAKPDFLNLLGTLHLD